MPLLNKKAFSTDPPPSDLKENEEIFVCRQTNEAYRDYETFFKRTILCNSLVWSCEISLKHSLTYEEAAESEQEARKTIEEVPQPIKRGVLTLVHYTRHSRLDNLCDEVFNYIRDRYQEGEEIDVKYKGEKLAGFIHNVIEPETLTNGFDSPKSKSKQNSSSGKFEDVVALGKTEERRTPKKKKNSPWPDPKSYQYMIKLKHTKNTPSKTPEFITVKQPCISRKKGAFNRDKLKLLLRLTCFRTGKGTEPGYWKVKDEYRRKFDLSPDVDDDEAIVVAKVSKKRKRESGKVEKNKKVKKSDEKEKAAGSAKTKKDKMDDKSKVEKPKLTSEEIEKLKQDLKLKREKEKELRKQERVKERQKRSELLKEQKMFLLHWCVPQEDLDLDDNKELPKPVPLESMFSPDMIGDLLMVLEFLYIFGDFFGIKQDFPDGITFDTLEDALTEHDAEGSFYDIIRFLLSSILKTHAEEEEDEGLDDIDHVDNHVKDADMEGDEDNDVKKAVSASAAMAAAWAQVHQGQDLHELTLDPFTCSEILRLHFLSSGASLVAGSDGDLYRWQRRGGFTFSDDAGVAFRHQEHAIMRALVTGNIYDLNGIEKMKILKTLCAQLVTYATTRDIIDDGFDRLRKAKRELQEEQWADQRKDKEVAAAKYRKRMEEKAKEREEKSKQNDEEKSEEAKNQESTKPDVPRTSNENKDDDKAYTRSQGPVMVEQSAEIENSEDVERIERKENLRRKEKAFLKEIRKAQSMSSVQPIGTDRLFRRYWIFNALNGLFIEDNDPNLMNFLQLDDNRVDISDDDANSDATSVSTEDDQPGPSTSSAIPHHTSSITSLSKESIEREKELCRILKLYNIPQESLPAKCVLNSGGSSLNREQICAQLKERDVVQWSYLDTKDDLDLLLKSLNPRGFREKHLRESLVESYDIVVKGLQDNPFKKESRRKKEELKQQPKLTRNQTVDKTLYKTMEEFIEASLRDSILDLEDRLWQAGLGVVKVADITSWRKQVENGIYDLLPDHKNLAVPERSEDGKQSNGCMDIDEQPVVNVDKTTENMDVDPQPSGNVTDFKLKLLSQDSRPGTPVDGSFTSTPTSSQTPRAINPCVRILAKAVLEVEQGIEEKYLIPPLGDDEETKKRRQQEAVEAAKRELNDILSKKKKEKIADDETNENDKPENDKADEKVKTKQEKTLLERWEESLLACTNLAQVFIHLTNLDNCISWDKSVLNARCRICRRKGDAEHMLLCDGCDKGHHMYCLKPPIKQVPEGDWFCSQCRPAEPRRSIRRARKVEVDDDDDERQDMKLLEMDDEEDSEDSQDENSDEESDDDDEDDEETDVDSGDEGSEDNDAQSSDDDGSVHMETCACCDGEGELLCCETCPLVYHLECAYPPLRRVPRGSWACQVCNGADQDLPSGRRVKKAVIKAAQQQAKGKEVSRSATRKTKVETKPLPTKQPRGVKNVTGTKRQKTRSNSPSTSPSTDLAQNSVRVRAPRVRTPKTSLPPSSGLSNSAPSKLAAWPAALARKCERLLKELMEHEDCWPFLAPVDHAKVPDYKLIIKAPMDLQTVKTKLSNHQYNILDEFTADIRQIFFNCSEYNRPRTKEARAGVRLSAYFETRHGELGLDCSEQRGPRTRRSR